MPKPLPFVPEDKTEQAKMGLKELREDLPTYARKFIRIRPKSGGRSVPLIFNKAQWLVHNFIEDMVKAGELVRVAIVKGRQQGCCLDPNTPVLTADLRWVPLRNVHVGDELIGVDEKVPGYRKHRKMQTVKVKQKWETEKIGYRIRLKSGKSLVASGDHKFLMQRGKVVGSVWRRVNQIRPGYALRYVTDTWGEPDANDGWMGGILDGEGSISTENETGAEVTIHQVDGPVWRRVIRYLTARGIHFNVSWDERDSKFGSNPVGRAEIGRMDDLFKLLGVTKPVRGSFQRRWWENRACPRISKGEQWDEIVGVEKLTEQPMIDIETTSGTFIANGFVSHNSTYVSARFLHKSTLNAGTSVFILAHLGDSTNYLFDMVKRMYYNLPEPLKPTIQRSNKKELKFGKIDSEYALGTAGSKEIGRSLNPHLLHLSEMAYYENTDGLATGLLQGVATELGTEIIAESTANGVNNMFYNLCMKGIDPSALTRYRTLFIPWYIQDEYREKPPARFKVTDEEEELMELYGLDEAQIFWRRRKLEDDYDNDLWKFKQEYPNTLNEAFVTSGNVLIKGEYLEKARKAAGFHDALAPRIMGVDGAGEGSDETAYVIRQGRRILEYKVYKEPVKPMRLAGIIARLIDTMELDMVFLDTAYGYGARDRLDEMGYGSKTLAVHFGEKAIMPELYKNKRAQMYGFLKDWFEEGGASIPDDDAFVRDLLMIPGFEVSGSRGLLIVPPKEKIRKENDGRSPNIADATALTFAFPVRARRVATNVSTADIDKVRARSPYKSRRLAQRHFGANRGFSGIEGRKEKPSEFYVR